MRKQLLLGSTALIVGALAAPDFAAGEEPLRLSVRGYKNEYLGLGDVDNDSNSDQESPNTFSDGEVHFKGSTDLDNGLTVGVHIELEASDNGDQIDEAYTFLQGDFGKVVIGSENLPDYLTFWAVTAPNVGVPINSGWISAWAVQPTGVGTGFRSSLQTTNLTLINDTFQIGYQSPRFSGFQFVAGYAPTSDGDGSTTATAPGGRNSGDPSFGPREPDTELTDIFSVGANFKESFNGVDVGFAVGYEHAEGKDGRAATAANVADRAALTAALGPLGAGLTAAGALAVTNETIASNATAATDDPQIFKFGASIGVSGFSVAGSYGIYDSDGSDDGESFDVGASYSTGPWGVSATYFHGEEEGTAGGGDDEVDVFMGAVSYAIGPGITGSLSVMRAEWEDEGGAESESTMGIIGLSIGF